MVECQGFYHEIFSCDQVNLVDGRLRGIQAAVEANPGIPEP
jgi:hypothetical protein